jgi:hypothetical protein
MPQQWIQYNTDNKMVGKAHFKNIQKKIASNLGTNMVFPCIFKRKKISKNGHFSMYI